MYAFDIYLVFGGCLNATIGSWGNISSIFLSLVSVHQCLVRILEMLRGQGLKVITKMTLSFAFFSTFWSANSLGTNLAFSMAALTMTITCTGRN